MQVRVEMGNAITIFVNGRERLVPRGQTLEAFVRSLDLDPRAVVVERNREIVRRGALAETALEEGDRVEVVHFVGGG